MSLVRTALVGYTERKFAGAQESFDFDEETRYIPSVCR